MHLGVLPVGAFSGLNSRSEPKDDTLSQGLSISHASMSRS
jgi:hypothetical protein